LHGALKAYFTTKELAGKESVIKYLTYTVGHKNETLLFFR